MVVGVLDSGIGGLTTLSTLTRVCGGEFVFVRDEKGPYGDKDDCFVLNRVFLACQKLRSFGAKIIVLACNTATNVAIERLRSLDPATNYIGVEPAVKPALEKCNRVAVALTPTAARQEKFRRLIGETDRVVPITVASLAPDIERGYFDRRLIERLARDLVTRCEGCDGLVLGCTHYIFLRSAISEIDSSITLFDGNDGVARRLYGFTGYRGPASIKFTSIS